MMGNRGILHDDEGRIRRPWQVKRWLLCVLEFTGRHRTVMAPNRYTELFFLDEAPGWPPVIARASSAAEPGSWPSATPGQRKRGTSGRTIRARDGHRLHAERVGPDRSKRTFRANLDELPDGVFVTLEGQDGNAHLLLGNELLAWSLGGYGSGGPGPGAVVTILTPRSTVAAIRAGYQPEVHPSAFKL